VSPIDAASNSVAGGILLTITMSLVHSPDNDSLLLLYHFAGKSKPVVLRRVRLNPYQATAQMYVDVGAYYRRSACEY
jgi:hypothetical protein